MKRCDMTMEELKVFLQCHADSKIICFGAGMVAQHINYLFGKNELWDRVCCFIDNDIDKQGEKVAIGDRTFPIMSLVELCQPSHLSDIVIILAEYAEQIEEQLTNHQEFTPQFYIAYTYINRWILQTTIEDETNKFHNMLENKAGTRIPPILHYCWFGPNEIPKDQIRYMQTWKEFCPNYTIMVWNEENYDLDICQYVREAYDTKNYAFVSDYVRMDVVYQYGGIYLDTDVELRHNLDWLRKYRAFFSFGKWPAVNSGCGFGAEPHSELIKEIRDFPRKKLPFVMGNGKLNMTTNCYYESAVLEKRGFKMDFSTQTIEDVLVLAPFFFPSAIHMDMMRPASGFIMAQHHDSGSWRK